MDDLNGFNVRSQQGDKAVQPLAAHGYQHPPSRVPANSLDDVLRFIF